MWVNKQKYVKGMQIDLGAGDPADGENQEKNMVLQDISLYPNIDLVCDILNIDKHIENDFCSLVRMSHVLEHFDLKERELVLKKVHKILQPEGILEIIVPNFRWHCELCLEGEEERAIYYAFGGQLDKFDYHKTGYTTKTLRGLLECHGFFIAEMQDNNSIYCLAIKTDG